MIYYEYKQQVVQKCLGLVGFAQVSLIIENIATEHDHINIMNQNCHNRDVVNTHSNYNYYPTSNSFLAPTKGPSKLQTPTAISEQ